MSMQIRRWRYITICNILPWKIVNKYSDSVTNRDRLMFCYHFEYQNIEHFDTRYNLSLYLFPFLSFSSFFFFFAIYEPFHMVEFPNISLFSYFYFVFVCSFLLFHPFSLLPAATVILYQYDKSRHNNYVIT